MIRIICSDIFFGEDLNGCFGPPDRSLHTFDVDLPDLERWLRSDRNIRKIDGFEIIEPRVKLHGEL